MVLVESVEGEFLQLQVLAAAYAEPLHGLDYVVFEPKW